MNTDDIYLRADRALTKDEKRDFLKHFTAVNPHLRGAQVADALDMLRSSDAHCGLIEDLIEVDEEGTEKAPRVAVTALCFIYIHGISRCTRPQIADLFNRIFTCA